MKKLLIILSTLAFSACAFANDLNEKKIVYNKVKSYADLVSCSNSFESDAENKTTLSDVILVNKDNISTKYYVLWGGDFGCFGGSGAGSSYITDVNKGSDDKFYVLNDFAFGDDIINYRYIESMRKISADKFIVVSWDFADEKFGGVDGGGNFPANKFEYTIELRYGDGWQITNKKLLEQRQ